MSKDFPNWMVGISSYLPYIMAISLIDLTACDSLPPLGRLPNLRNLELYNIPNIRKIGKEFYGEEGICRKLRMIDLGSLQNLDEFWTTRSGDEDEQFLIPNLHQLVIKECPKLKFLPYPPKSLLWSLRYSDVVLPLNGFGRLSSSTVPFAAKITSHNFSIDVWTRLQHLATLEELKICGRRSLSSLDAEATPCFPSLRRLDLLLPDLEILPEWLGQVITLEVLRILFCRKLTSLPESIRNLTALKILDIWRCPRLVERCKGADAHKISHIPEVKLDGKIFIRERPIERLEVRGTAAHGRSRSQ
ncbi:hypothetical protein BS78_08G136100 [Paspalum vaginatum]|nr:hypothetical protein BS78_08G136100 [Paspalum vaginatum]